MFCNDWGDASSGSKHKFVLKLEDKQHKASVFAVLTKKVLCHVMTV